MSMILPATGARYPARLAGYSIVELMVAITIGLIILAALVGLFANNSRTRMEIDRANQQTENGRYALQMLEDDLHNAGYLAEFNPAVLATPAAKPDPCSAVTADLNAAMPIAVQGYDNGAGAPTCLPTDLSPNTDILVVRRASSCATTVDPGCDAPVVGDAYIQASGCNNAAELGSGNIANFYNLAILPAATPTTVSPTTVLHQRDCITNPPGKTAGLHQYRTHIYFIAKNDKTGDGIATLKRAELGVNAGGVLGFSTVVPLVEGIENMQIEYGLDIVPGTGALAFTGAPAVFTANPDLYRACTPATTPTCADYWRNTVAVKIYLLTRNTTATPGYTDTKVYTLGLKADGTPNTVPAPNDGYKRHVYESEIRLNNPSGRNTP